ncbi:MAG: OsmC family protein [Thermodesulfobacteriota bacterium]
MLVQATWKKNYQVEVNARQFRVDIDEAPQFGGEDTGMMPTELFLCSLASCFCLALVYVAKMEKTEIKDIRVDVRGEKDRKEFLFSKLVVEIYSSLPDKYLMEIIKLAQNYCFVSKTISRSCPIEYIIV